MCLVRALSLLLIAAVAPTMSWAGPHDLRLIEAIKQHDARLRDSLLAQRVNVDSKGADGSTALHWAVYYGDEASVDRLLRAHASSNLTNDLGVTPLLLAATQGSSALVTKLLNHGADPNLAPALSGTPLMLAVRTGEAEAVKALLDHGANPNGKEAAHSQTALMWAVDQGSPEIIDMLLKKGADLHARTQSRERTVLLCCQRFVGDREGLSVTLQGGLTALLFAAERGRTAAARLLLTAGADSNDVSASGTTALALATLRGHADMAKVLLDAGANPNNIGSGYAPLHAAVLWQQADLVESLLEHGADPNVRLRGGTLIRRFNKERAFDKNYVGATPYLLAARMSALRLMRILAARGADVTLTLADGRTPLMVAIEFGEPGNGVQGGVGGTQLQQMKEPDRFEAVKLIMSLGADVNAVDKKGNTPLHVAVAAKTNSIVEFLVGAGAQLGTRNLKGQTPLQLAMAPPEPLVVSASSELPRWRAEYAKWKETGGVTSTTLLLRKLGAVE